MLKQTAALCPTYHNLLDFVNFTSANGSNAIRTLTRIAPIFLRGRALGQEKGPLTRAYVFRTKGQFLPILDCVECFLHCRAPVGRFPEWRLIVAQLALTDDVANDPPDDVI